VGSKNGRGHIQLKKIQELANNSKQVKQLKDIQSMADRHVLQAKSKGEKNSGLPSQLKSGVESLSGISMDDVTVHYNSSQPAQLQAHAYAQGTDIHLAPGQEKHLPHEVWHVVQQKQGRVEATTQLKGDTPINDNAGLEREADEMGDKAMHVGAQSSVGENSPLSTSSSSGQNSPAQLRKIGKFGMEAEVLKQRFKMISLKSFPEAEILADPEIVLEEFSLGILGNRIKVTLDNEVSYQTNIERVRSFTVEFVANPVDVLTDDPADLQQMETAWGLTSRFWKTNLLHAHKVIGMVGQAVDWFTQNKYWEAPQFDKYHANENVTPGDESSKLHWDGPGFFTYIDATTEDPDVAMQMTAGSTLETLQAMYLASLPVMAGHAAPTQHQIGESVALNQPSDDTLHPEAWALLSILKRYKDESFHADTEILMGNSRPKRYQKEYISLMVRNSLAGVFGSMSPEARQVFIGWVMDYAQGRGPIQDEFIQGFGAAFFSAPATKERQATQMEDEDTSLSNARVLIGIINPYLDEADRDPIQPGDAFSQVTPPLAGLGELHENAPDQLQKYGITSPGEMMAGVRGLIAESRASKVRPLSEMPEVYRQLVIALQRVEELYGG